MIISNATQGDIDGALEAVTKQFGGNVVYNRAPEPVGRRFRLTLRVKSSKGPGARKSASSGRAMVAACWHVHGHFFEALFELNPRAVVMVGGGQRITAESGNWKDRNIGSQVHPVMFSEACGCN